MQHFYSFASQICHCWCPPFCAGHAAFLFICFSDLPLLVSALLRWPCSIFTHLLPRSVTAGVRPFALATRHFYSFASQICHCWCPPFCAGHASFLFICFPDLSLLASALLRWPCSISIHLLPRSVTAGVRPFALATRHFYSFVSQVCHCWRPPFSTDKSFVSQLWTSQTLVAECSDFEKHKLSGFYGPRWYNSSQ